MKNREGFTLIELLLVVAIIGILVLIFAPNNSIFSNAQVREIQGNAKILDGGMINYYSENNSYPSAVKPVSVPSIDKNTISIIKAQLTSKNLLSYAAYNDIVNADGLKNIDGTKIQKYAKVDLAKLNNYFYIDNVPATANYSNELSGYVFSYTAKKDAQGNIYSGGSNVLVNQPSVSIQPCDTGGFTCIMTAAELNNIRTGLNSNYRLGADIDLAGYNPGDGLGWSPIGNSLGTAFTGQLDGNGFKIKNLRINRGGTDYVGLFGYISASTLRNIILTNVNVIGRDRVGSLTGYAITATLSNIEVAGVVTSTGQYVGGMAGTDSGGNMWDHLVAKVNVSGVNYVGGLIGAVSGASAIIDHSYATGNVSGTGNAIGGLVGAQYASTTIQYAFASGAVTSTGVDVGGLVGFRSGPASGQTTLVVDSYASGSANGSAYVGGLIGLDNSGVTTILRSYSIGTVTSGAQKGGAISYMGSATITNLFYDSTTSGQSDTRGAPKTTSQMQTQATFTGFDFTNVWLYTPGYYPTLKNMP
jgi:prepilin-type N-terminal cleavage/methylation domain-containing protein